MRKIPLTLISSACAENMGKLKLTSNEKVLITTQGSGSFVCGFCGEVLIQGDSLPPFSNAAGYCNNCGWINHLTKVAKYPDVYSNLLRNNDPSDIFFGRQHSLSQQGPISKPLQELNSELYKIWSSFHKQRPPVIYHYTTINGLIGMLKDGKIWATDIRFLNDSSEFQYARDIISARIEKEKETSTHTLWQKTFWERAQRVVDSKPGDYRFITCFCENSDLLSQWRGYAGGTGGFCVGFDSNFINNKAISEPGFFLRRVIYDPDKQKEIVGLLFSQINLKLSELLAHASEKECDNIVAFVGHVAGTLIEEILYTFKHPSFYEEKEWRCVMTSGLTEELEELKFRTSGPSIVPYTELNFPVANNCPLLPIRKLIQGPATNKEYGKIAAISLLLKYGYDFVEIENSNVPLRF